jgi:hypothetical protein
VNQIDAERRLAEWHRRKEGDRPRASIAFLVPGIFWVLACIFEGIKLGTLYALPITILCAVMYIHELGKWEERWRSPYEK